MSIEELRAENQWLKDRNAVLTRQLDWIKRHMFGRKSERFEHPDLFDPAAPGKEMSSGDATAPEDEPQTAAQAAPKRERKIRGQRVPEHLPVIEEQVAPPAEVLADPAAWRKTSCETGDQLEKEPGYFYLRRTVR